MLAEELIHKIRKLVVLSKSKPFAQTFFIVLFSILVTSCMVYVSSEDAEIVASKITAGSNDNKVCEKAAILEVGDNLIWRENRRIWRNELEKRGLDCTQILNQQSNVEFNLALNAAGVVEISEITNQGASSIVSGSVEHPTLLENLRVDDTTIEVDEKGAFTQEFYTGVDGRSLEIISKDIFGNETVKIIKLVRSPLVRLPTVKYSSLNPLKRRVIPNPDALALIIGVSDYKNTPAKAVFADSDAKMFRDYASKKLGIPDSRIKTLVNDSAGEREMLLSVKSWLSRSVKQDKTDVYIFFAGHGLASDDGQKMYLLPHDGEPELLEDTAISKARLFSDIYSANPLSVTVFLDTCYSGTTRGTETLIVSRPISIKVKQQSIPDNFTVMTAAAGNQTAKPLEEAKHGMFSYFLMKGMEGEADADNDNQITTGELHAYVEQNVVQQSSGSQTPELQGDRDRVLVRFQ